MVNSAHSMAALRLAERMSRLGTESAFDVLVRARALEAGGASVVHLEIGEPDFETPKHIVEAAIRALRDGWTHYGPAAGLPALREAIAEHESAHLAIPVDPSEVVVTPGGKPIICFAMLALVQEGDEVLFPDPGFPIYQSLIRFAGATPVPYGFVEEQDFAVNTGELLEKLSPRTRLLILNSPHNPTGAVMTRTVLQHLAAELQSRNVMVLSDEIYSRLLYEGEHHSISQFPGMKERTIVLNGFSKTYAMTGWRLGYGIMRADLAQKFAQLMTNSNSCTTSFIQIAGIQALRGDQSCVEQMLAAFRERRQVIVDGLNRLGFVCRRPGGAFYVFPDVSASGFNEGALADVLLADAGVACLGGTAFGARGRDHLRLSFANSVENIREALRRMEARLSGPKPHATPSAPRAQVQ